MNMSDVQKLMNVPEFYTFVLNVDSNFDCSSGYASWLDSQFNIHSQLVDPNIRNLHFWDEDIKNNRVGSCILLGRVLVVVTRVNDSETLTPEVLDECIANVRKVVDHHHIAHLAYPHIGYDNGITADQLMTIFNKHFAYNGYTGQYCLLLPLEVIN